MRTQKFLTGLLVCMLVLAVPISPAKALTGQTTTNTCLAGNKVDRSFWEMVIPQLNPAPQNIDFVVQAFQLWLPYENTVACWNPLATTKPMPGSTKFNNSNVQNYPDKATGATATALTLNLSYYTAIRQMFAWQGFNEAGIQASLKTWIGSDSYAASLTSKWKNLYDQYNSTFVIVNPLLSPALGSICATAWYQVTGTGYNGSNVYLTLNTNQPSQSTNSAKWVPSIPKAGRWNVEVYIGHHGVITWSCPTKTIYGDTSDARYKISYSGGSATKTINQLPLDNQWASLGEFYFALGTSGYIQLTDLNGESNISRTVSFNVIRLTWVGP